MRARGDLLAGAALAEQQHGRVGARDLAQRVDHRLHRRIAVGQPAGRSCLALALLAAVAQPAALERARHQQAQLVGPLDRLLEVVERAELHRLDRGLDRAVRGQHDDLDLGLLGARASHERHAVEAGHLEIGDDDVEALGFEPADRGGAVGRLLHVVTVRLQRLGQERADALVVVDHQDAGHRSAAQGITTRNSAPPSGCVCAVTAPPCSSTMRRATARPSPVPWARVV